MQPVPEGYKPLGFAGFTDKGGYSASEVYAENDIVHKDNTAWRCLINGTAGIEPAEGESWTVFVVSTSTSSGITTTDTAGIVGSVGESVSNQSIIDALSERVVSDRAMLSDAFSTSKAYTSGDYAIYDNTLYRFTSVKSAGAWDASKAMAVSVAGELDALNENFTGNYYRVFENTKPFVDTVLQKYTVKKSGYYLIVTNARIFGVTEGTLPCTINAYDIGNINIFDGADPVSAQTCRSEYSWVTLVSIEKMTKGTHDKYFRVPDIHTDNFNTRTILFWLGNS